MLKRKKEPEPKIYTEETCSNCGEKIKRNFIEGDYIFKDAQQCKKCSSISMITAIYGEYPPEKEKRGKER